MTKIQQLWDEQRQSLWLDDISRTMLKSGTLEKQIEQDGIRGITSNPTIFEKAIAAGDAYDDQVADLIRAGKSSGEIFETVEVDDIRGACDLFTDLYKASGGNDGYVSIEVAPEFARNTEGTIEEVRRLWSSVDRPNLMVKIPGTAEGIPAIKQALTDGISVNVTLLFSVERYADVATAYVEALEARHARGDSIETLASVASFFVSRVDTLIDSKLDERIAADPAQADLAGSLKGKIAVANAKLAYQTFLEIFESDRFAPLRAAGGNVQRPLWASTGTKNPAYSDVLYVDSLIGPDTVTTVPGKTIIAFIDHGVISRTIDSEVDAAHQAVTDLERVGVDLRAATAQLEDEGLATFSKSFESLIEGVEGKRAALAETVAS